MDSRPIAKISETRRLEQRVDVRYEVIQSDPTCGFKRLAVLGPDRPILGMGKHDVGRPRRFLTVEREVRMNLQQIVLNAHREAGLLERLPGGAVDKRLLGVDTSRGDSKRVRRIARLAPRFKLVTLAEGQTAFQEGENEGALYLIKEGSVVVEMMIRDELIELARLGKHQFFGEVSFLTGVSRTATVHSLEDGTELLKIEEEELKELLRHHPYMKDVLSRYHLDRVTATAETLKSFLKNEKVEGIVS